MPRHGYRIAPSDIAELADAFLEIARADDGHLAILCGTSFRLRRLARLPALLAQHLAHGAADNSGHVLAQDPNAFFDPVEAPIDLVEPAIDFVESAVDLVESLLRSRLEREQVLVNALDLLGQEPERAFDLADAALQVTNLGFDIPRHGKSLP